ncbi:MAG: matrixin family metalloprotease [Myxococcota bacterium]|nr:matrixin family metalloprotease [Myxococcota bacterium]
MKARILLVILSLCANLALFAEPAHAWLQTETCGSTQFPCGPGESPKGIFWPVSCVLVHLNEKGTASIPFEEIERVTRLSLETWSKVDCSHLQLIYAGQTNEDRVGYNEQAIDNANVLIFRDHDWPHASGALGLASVTFDRDTGEIVDTDIEFNTRDFVFTSTTSMVLTRVDLQNTLTHELGHLVGLDHPPEKEATMYATAPDGETKKRSLHADDIDGICTIYPLAEADAVPVCNRHRMGYFRRPSFSLTESAPQEGCSLSAGLAARTPLLPLWLSLLLAPLMLIKRLRRATPRAPS